MFIENLDIRVLGNGEYQLLEKITYKWNNVEITCHEGFVCNLASIPKYLFEEIGCPIDFAYEGVLHDLLYATGIYDRKTCDKIFHSALLSRGVSKPKAKVMYLAVRVAGEEYYKKEPWKYRDFISISIK